MTEMSFGEHVKAALEKHQTPIVAIIDALTTVADGLKATEIAQYLRAIREDLCSKPFQLMVIGRSKCGKSTLLNALLGKPTRHVPELERGCGPLPIDDLPCTPTIIQLIHNKTPTVRAFLYDGAQQEWSFSDFVQQARLYVGARDNSPLFEKIQGIELGFPSQILQAGIQFYDSPGCQDDTWRNVSLERVLSLSNAALVVFRDIFIDISALEYLDLAETYAKHVFIVVNVYRGQEANEEFITFVRERLARKSRDHSIYFLNADAALRAVYADDEKARAASGLLELERGLADFLLSDACRILDATLEKILRSAQTLRDTIFAKRTPLFLSLSDSLFRSEAAKAEINEQLKLLHTFESIVTWPPEVVAQGAHAIWAYLEDLRKTAEPLYEAKIVLAGEGATGKTTLKERLIHNRLAIASSTRGLEMETTRRAHRTKPGTEITLNFWDFGGQEDYRPAQQFFFSKGALYIVVWHARYDTTQSNVEAWLRLIRRRVGEEARVLVVATHADMHKPGSGVRQLCMAKFGGMIASFHEVDNKSGRGIPELWAAIEREIVTLPGFGAERPKSWIDARDAILARRSAAAAHQMPIAEFRKIAEEHGVSADSVDTFAATLSLQGRIVYHSDDPHLAGTVVLDPEWLMKAIAYVMTDELTQKANGILAESSLDRIWLHHNRPPEENPFHYQKEHWNHLLRMMDRHEIVYQLTKQNWLVGPLVPVVKPETMPWDGRCSLDGGPLVRAECRLEGEIPGLMALFTVRNHFHHYDFQQYYWRGGVLLRDRVHPDTLALIESKSVTCLAIATTGTFASNFMVSLISGLEQLIEEMWPGGVSEKNRPYRFIVPCPTEDCFGHYSRNDLVRKLGRETEAECHDGKGCKYDVGLLLTGTTVSLSMYDNLISQVRREFSALYGAVRSGFASVDGKLDGIKLTLDDMRSAIGDILSYVSNEAPRIYSLKLVEPARWNLLHRVQDLFKHRIEIQIWCEEMKRPVPGAVEVVALDREWVRHLREWSPRLRKLITFATALGAGAAAWGKLAAVTPEMLKILRDCTNQVLDKVDNAPDFDELKAGRGDAAFSQATNLERGQFVEPSIAKVLCTAAKKGGMTRIQMDDDKRWRWVSREIAERNDRSVPKESD